MKASPRVVAVFVLFILLALGVRLTYLFQATQSPVGRLMVLDSAVYQDRALVILHGRFLPTEVFRMSPAYPYLLSAIYWVSGTERPNVGRLWQAFLGAIGCGLTYLLGRRLFGARAGTIAGVLYILCGPLVFTEGLILAESALCFLHLVFLLLLLAAMRRSSVTFGVIAGLALGLCAALRGNVLLYTLPLCIFFLMTPRGVRMRALGRVGLPMLAGVVVPIGLVIAANYHAEGDLVLLSSNAGFNFYIGNHAKSSGVFDKIEGHDESRGFDPTKDLDGRDFARSIVGRRLSPSEASRFWFRATFDSARGRWGDFVLRLLKKGLLFFSATEIPQICSYTVAREESSVLRLLPVSFAVLTPLGLFGLALALRGKRERRLIATLCLCYVASVVMFFVVGRYRITIIPLFLAFSGGAVSYAIDALRRNAWPRLVKTGVAISVLAILPIATTQPHEDRAVLAHFAQLYASVGEAQAARRVAGRGIERYPNDGRLLCVMGDLALADGDLPAAIDYYRRATESTERQADYFFKLANSLAATGGIDEALDAATAGLEMAPADVEGLLLLAQLQRQKGDIDGAIRTLEKAARLAPNVPEVDRILHELQRTTGSN